MKRFIYKAIEKSGNPLAGEVEAENEKQAAKLVKNKGLFLVSLKPKKEIILRLKKVSEDKVGLGEITTFTRQLATMINAGLPIIESLAILRAQSKVGMQKITSQLLTDVEGGESFSGALEKHTKVFSPTYIALIKSGELGGVLDKVLLRLAESLEKQREFKSKVKGALTYPVIIITGMAGAALMMVVFVIPRLTSLYTEFDIDLPMATKVLIAFSNAVMKMWLPLIILIGILAYGYMVYRKSPEGKYKTDGLIFKLPIAGELYRKIILTEVTRTLSLMVGVGVSILEAVNISAQVMKNEVISSALKDVSIQVEKGFPVAFAFSKHPEAFPLILSQMVSVGEETGKMSDVLDKVSRVFESESDQKVKNLTTAIEPIIMILLGIGVGFLVIAIIMPIYKLTSSF